MAVWWVGRVNCQVGDEAETRGTDKQPLCDKPPLILRGDEGKSVTFCFLKLETKQNSRFLQNHQGES